MRIRLNANHNRNRHAGSATTIGGMLVLTLISAGAILPLYAHPRTPRGRSSRSGLVIPADGR